MTRICDNPTRLDEINNEKNITTNNAKSFGNYGITISAIVLHHARFLVCNIVEGLSTVSTTGALAHAKAVSTDDLSPVLEYIQQISKQNLVKPFKLWPPSDELLNRETPTFCNDEVVPPCRINST